jgi:ATP-dependent helicase/nuclease subunit A
MSALRFELDGVAVDAEVFRRAAIDPQRSVVVDACAGSGKTTLLVTRIVRALLEGAAPDQILAITFTRLAAHEMRERLTATLRRLALSDSTTVNEQLTAWFGLDPDRAAELVERARGLYEAVLGHPRGMDITTFHSWFRVIGQSAPLSDPAMDGAELSEDASGLMHQAWYAWLDQLRRPEAQARRLEFERLIADQGLHKTRACLFALLASRTDWALAHGIDLAGDAALVREAGWRAGVAYDQAWRSAVGRLMARMSGMRAPSSESQGAGDALSAAGCAPKVIQVAVLRALAADASWLSLVQRCVAVLAQGSAKAVRDAQDLEVVLTAAPGLGHASDEVVIEWFKSVLKGMLSSKGQPRSWQKSASLQKAIALASAPVEIEWLRACEQVREVQALYKEAEEVRLNARLMACGADLLAVFCDLKRMHGLMDFADLEAVAFGLLRDPALAAYVQCRMDRRYRHLLFDEFQDTSSLQWRVIADWLTSYAGAGSGERPSVFIVGDPKQSIYRFRRAEARVFDAAKALLRTVFDARLAATDTTRRNAPEVVAVLNESLPPVMPHYRIQATAASGPGLVWRLPLIESGGGVEPDEGDGVAGNEFSEASDTDSSDSLSYQEGRAIARAILAARQALAARGRTLAWGEVLILARSRSGFAAYEQALREYGLPVHSDRRGGLLQALEVDDLRSLLSFVRRPSDDLALAQVLASPLFDIDEANLGAWLTEVNADFGREDVLASESRVARGLWARLQAHAQHLPEGVWQGHPVGQWLARLKRWIDLARERSPHDFLDAVLAESDAMVRYAAAVAPAQRGVVLANLHALLGHALDFDGGRCPSLARYLARLRGLDMLEDREGPSQGRSTTLDAIRLMTIHASKGLEADLVVLADAHAQPRAEGARLFVDWSPEWSCPEHVSFVQGKDAAQGVRRERLAREEELRAKEECNLLYVALTRARYGVIVSGVQRKRVAGRTWYTTLAGVPEPPSEVLALGMGKEASSSESDGVFMLRCLDLPPLGVGRLEHVVSVAPIEDAWSHAAGEALALEFGHALHRALELWPEGHDRDTVRAALQVFNLNDAQRDAALQHAEAVLCHPALLPAFAPETPAWSEFEVFDGQGQLRRIDRLAQVEDALWIIDYKWSVAPSRHAAYAAQLAEYRALIEGLKVMPWGPVHRVRTVLVDAKAGRVDFDVDRLQTASVATD